MAQLKSTTVEGSFGITNSSEYKNDLIFDSNVSLEGSGTKFQIASGSESPFEALRVSNVPGDDRPHYIIIGNAAGNDVECAGTLFGARRSGNSCSGMIDIHASSASRDRGITASLFSRAHQQSASTWTLKEVTFEGTQKLAIELSLRSRFFIWNRTGLYFQGFRSSGVELTIVGASEVSNVSNWSNRHGTSFFTDAEFSAPSKNFKIDHPVLENSQLIHGSIEAPRYDLIYRGKIQLHNGRATVDIDQASTMTPGTFDSLTTFARVTSLQNQTGFTRLKPSPIVNGKFEIHAESNDCNDLVHWTVMAERKDIDPLIVEKIRYQDSSNEEE